MNLTITIQMDNSAFEENPGLEVAGLLSSVAHKAEYAGSEFKAGWHCAIIDTNGNKVGSAEVEED